MSQRAFINQVKDGAVSGWQKYKVLPSISIAQAALESGWGGSTLAKAPNYNLFGIKASSDWTGPTVKMRTQEWSSSKGYYYVYADFRVYSSWAHSIEQHGAFFTNTAWRKNNYRKVIGEKNYKTAAQELRNAGYATDPNYPGKLVNIIEQYNLQQYDKAAMEGGSSNVNPPHVTPAPIVTSPGAADIKSVSYDDDIFVSPTGESVIYNKTLNDQFGFRPKKGQVMWIERILKVNSDDPKEMLKEGLAYMREHSAPAAQYEVSLKELPDTVAIGDTGIFIDHEFDPPLAIEARVLEITTSETVPNSNTVTIGNVKELFPKDKEDILALQRQLQETRDGLLEEFHRGAPLKIVIENSNGLFLSGNRSDFETELIQGAIKDRAVPEGEHVIELASLKKIDNDFRLSGKLANNIIAHVDDLIIGEPITAEDVIVPKEGENPQGEPTPDPLEPQDTHELDVAELRMDFLDGFGKVVLEETVPLYLDSEFAFPIENFDKEIRKIKIYAPKDLTFERISFTEKEANRAGISSTRLVARVYQGDREVTERFNNFSWVRVSGDFRADEGWNDANKFVQENHITIYADDIEQEESVFMCRLLDDDFETILASSLTVVMIGAEGKSAYQVAVENGFEGTLSEWIDSLKGKDGKNGIPGEPGKDGRTPYTHIAYASSADGSVRFSISDPTDRAYVGMYTDFNSADSQDYTKYKWMLVKGEKGERGEKGKDASDLRNYFIASTLPNVGENFIHSDLPEGGWRIVKINAIKDKEFTLRTDFADESPLYLRSRRKGGDDSSATTRNLLLDSRLRPTYTNKYNIARFHIVEKPIVGETYSITIKGELGSQKKHFGVYNSGGMVYLGNLTSAGDGLYTAEVKWKNDNGSTVVDDSFISIYAVPDSVEQESKIEWATMVKGHVPLAEWTPAHEDGKIKNIPLSGMTATCEQGYFEIVYPEEVEDQMAKMREGYRVYIHERTEEELTWEPSTEDVIHLGTAEIRDELARKANAGYTEAFLNELKIRVETLLQEQEALATKKEVNDFIQAYRSFLDVQHKDKVQAEKDLTNALTRVAELENELGDMAVRWKFIDKEISMSEEGLIIGQRDKGTYTLQSDDRISFYNNGTEVAFISGGVLQITQAVFLRQVQINSFILSGVETDHLTFRYVGDGKHGI